MGCWIDSPRVHGKLLQCASFNGLMGKWGFFVAFSGKP